MGSVSNKRVVGLDDVKGMGEQNMYETKLEGMLAFFWLGTFLQ